MRQTIRN